MPISDALSWDLPQLECSCCTTNETFSFLQLLQHLPSESKEALLHAHRHINYQVMCIKLKHINFHIVFVNKCNIESYKSLYLISSNGKEESNQKCNICSQYTLLRSYSTSALLRVQVIENRMVAACSQDCQRQITAHYTSTKGTFTWECKQPISSLCSLASSRNFFLVVQ